VEADMTALDRHALPAWVRLPFLIVLLMALIEFGQVWYYPGGDRGIEAVRAFGGAYRLVLWLCAVAAITAHLVHRGPGPMAQALWPFAPFIAWGVVAVVFWSVDRVTGVRALIFWSLASGLAVAAGHEVEPRALARWVALLFAAIVAASLALAVVDPSAAYTYYGDSYLIRGLFPHKNQLGWYCAVGLLWSLALHRAIGWARLALVVPVLLAGLVVVDSTTAQATVLSASVFGLALTLAARLLREGARAALAMVVGVIVVAVLVVQVAPALIEQVGRDATLTGRTDVWRHYLAYVQDRMLTGFGTGIFSINTGINLEIGNSVPGYERENLRSPHNVYLGLVGETGIAGVVLFLAAQLYCAFVMPFRRLSAWLRLAGMLAFAILVAGIAEMRDGYAPGVATVALLAARAGGLRAGPRPPPAGR
jgi:exopolysaccharide production protein ExoQ